MPVTTRFQARRKIEEKEKKRPSTQGVDVSPRVEFEAISPPEEHCPPGEAPHVGANERSVPLEEQFHTHKEAPEIIVGEVPNDQHQTPASSALRAEEDREQETAIEDNENYNGEHDVVSEDKLNDEDVSVDVGVQTDENIVGSVEHLRLQPEDPQVSLPPMIEQSVLRSEWLYRELAETEEQLKQAKARAYQLRRGLWLFMRDRRLLNRIDDDWEMRVEGLFKLRLEQYRLTNRKHIVWREAYMRLQKRIETEESALPRTKRSIQRYQTFVMDWLRKTYPEDLNKGRDDGKCHSWHKRDLLSKAQEDVAALLRESDEDIRVEDEIQLDMVSARSLARRRFFDARADLARAEDALEAHFDPFNYPVHVERHRQRVDAGEQLPPADIHILLTGGQRARDVAIAVSEYSVAATNARRLRAVPLQYLSSRFSSSAAHTEWSEPFGLGGIGMPKDYSKIDQWLEHASGDVESDGVIWSTAASSQRSEAAPELVAVGEVERDFRPRTRRHHQLWSRHIARCYDRMLENWDENGFVAERPKPALPDTLCVGLKRKRGAEEQATMDGVPPPKRRRIWPCSCDIM